MIPKNKFTFHTGDIKQMKKIPLAFALISQLALSNIGFSLDFSDKPFHIKYDNIPETVSVKSMWESHYVHEAYLYLVDSRDRRIEIPYMGFKMDYGSAEGLSAAKERDVLHHFVYFAGSRGILAEINIKDSEIFAARLTDGTVILSTEVKARDIRVMGHEACVPKSLIEKSIRKSRPDYLPNIEDLETICLRDLPY